MGITLTALLALALMSCQRDSAGAPDASACGTFNSCAQTTAAAVTRLSRLATTPGLEWSREVGEPGRGSPGAPILLEANHKLAASVSSSELWLLDTADGAGTPIFRVGLHNSVGNAAADAEENLYAATSSMVIALTPQGQTRWALRVPTFEPNVGPPPAFAVSPGGVFVASPDGNLYKLDRSDGQVLWRAALGLSSYDSLAGSLDTIYVGTERGVLAVDASTGALRWRPLVCRGLGVNMLTRNHALVSSYLDGITVGSGLDACGQHSFELPAWHSRILELSDGSTALMVGAPVGARDHIDHLAPDGSVLERIELGLAALRGNDLYAIGSDDTAYVLECYRDAAQQVRARMLGLHLDTVPATTELVAELGEQCATYPAGGVIGQDGVLYFALGGSIIALQTWSQGPAVGSWSVPGGDNRNSHWHP